MQGGGGSGSGSGGGGGSGGGVGSRSTFEQLLAVTPLTLPGGTPNPRHHPPGGATLSRVALRAYPLVLIIARDLRRTISAKQTLSNETSTTSQCCPLPCSFCAWALPVRCTAYRRRTSRTSRRRRNCSAASSRPRPAVRPPPTSTEPSRVLRVALSRVLDYCMIRQFAEASRVSGRSAVRRSPRGVECLTEGSST